MRVFRLMVWIIVAVVALAFAACSDNDTNEVGPQEPLQPEIPERLDFGDKVIAVSIDGEANFEYLASKSAIDNELKKIKDYGFNTIYLDVKPGNGRALYKSDILKPCNIFGHMTVERDYDDYLGYFLEKGKELGIDIVATIFTCGWGINYEGDIQEGFVYDNLNEWKEEIQVRNHIGSNLLVSDIEETKQTPVYFSPASTKFQDFIVEVVGELVTKYPDLKGINLDYLRYGESNKGWYGMGDLDLEAYARYWNESKPEPNEIIIGMTEETGPKFAKWIECRSAMVKTVIEKIRKRVKEINPNCEVQMWSSSDWTSRYSQGQNWASVKYIPEGYQYTDTYNRTGCAHLLDTFVSGAYAEQIWEYEDPANEWCVERFCKHWNDYIMDECKCVTAVPAYAYMETPQKMTDAAYLCLRYSNGFRAFELSYMNKGNLWEAALKGFERYAIESKKL